MAKILSGKEVAEAMNARIREKTARLAAQGVVPKLAVIRCGEDLSDLSYERGILKRASVTGIETEQILLPASVTAEELISRIEELNADPGVHGVLLFRPLPAGLRPMEREICNHLVPEKDVDSMTDLSCAGVYEGKDLGFPPCTPSACMEILRYYGYDLAGKNAVVIGRSLVVGKPMAMMLLAANATVTVCHTKTADIKEVTSRADLIVTSAGRAGFLTGEYVRPGQTVIDVSVNWDPAKNDGRGGITGDAVFGEIEPLVDAVTPVPGGVGSVTTSVLMSHVAEAAEKFPAAKD